MTDSAALVERTLALIDAAFADAPRPPNAELLHEECADDNDIVALYPVAHWRNVPDQLVETEYAALSFLSPPGFRHFIPAYMRFTLPNSGTGAAAVDSTIWSLSPEFYDDQAIREFVGSKLAALGDAQREAVVAFLGAIAAVGEEYEREEAEKALRHWR
jgi:hypothetical protein